MQRYFLPVILYVLFLIEGTVMPLITPAAWQSRIDLTSHFTFIVILFIAIYVSRHWALAYGLAFGMLHDIVYYGPMLGTYTFGFGLVGYLIGLLSYYSKANLLRSMLLIILGDFLLECLLYGIYRIFQITHISVHFALTYHILPSLLINLLFAILIYVPIRKLLENVGAAREREEEEDFN
ncbi:rod shape-determining protein MreD [Paenibacillus psychroresistens]|uniref:Rod shape-determining protein MreD n=1 Tax=Paenibacillus psychroresistens TaxID=1778678 RepID=A0A6B8RIN1_9BACL|nr:rod shape-determining protein MreD [Paenibacillus psychroresistens]QGQ95393.1 rod shape-determining protein MreD [Paenibacillus psychroresistens]